MTIECVVDRTYEGEEAQADIAEMARRFYSPAVRRARDRPLPYGAAHQLRVAPGARPRPRRPTLRNGPATNRLRRDARAVPPDRADRLLRGGRGSRLLGRDGCRPSPAVGPGAGPSRLRVGVHGRRRGTHQGRYRPRRHVPVVPDAPGRHRPGRGNARRHVPGSLLAGPGIGRGAERARRRRVLAGGARADQSDVRGHRDVQPPLHRPGRQARRPLLQDGDRPTVDGSRDAAADLRRDGWARSRPSAPGKRRAGSSPSARPRGSSR